jgi:hypothetical protein
MGVLSEAVDLISRLEAVDVCRSELVTWDLVHQLQDAAELARELGQRPTERRLWSWSTKCALILAARLSPDAESTESQHWLG